MYTPLARYSGLSAPAGAGPGNHIARQENAPQGD
jgi:hypothetical protein